MWTEQHSRKEKENKEKEKVHSSLIRLLRHEHHLHPPIAFVSVGTGREGEIVAISSLSAPKTSADLAREEVGHLPLFSSLFSNPQLSSLSSFSLVSLCTHLISFLFYFIFFFIWGWPFCLLQWYLQELGQAIVIVFKVKSWWYYSFIGF